MPDIEKTAPIIEPEKVAKTVEEVEAEKLAELGKGKPTQTEEENREQARRRRQDDEKKALEKRELDTAIKLTGGKNPFTQEKIVDQADLDELYLMKEIEASGGDPVADYAKTLKKKQKEESKVVNEKTMTEEQAKSDWQSFQTAYPAITLKSLQDDADFLDYAEGKIGNKPLSKIYEGYLRIKGKTEPKKETVKPSPGPLGGEVAPNTEFYTMEQIDKFTAAQLHAMSAKEFEKVQKSKVHWAKK
jgi:hypothetical protein